MSSSGQGIINNNCPQGKELLMFAGQGIIGVLEEGNSW